MIRFDIITLFPQLYEEHLNNLPFKKAKELGLAEYNLWNLRDFSIDKHKTVDDRPYSGGTGMILMIEPIYKALVEILGEEKLSEILLKKKEEDLKTRIILLSPKGETYNQGKARELSQSHHVIFICGRYEGVDNRVSENLTTDVISIGNYVLSGGELASQVIMESVTRILPNVLEKEDASKIESFNNGVLEYPQYTRPENFKGMKVPNILLSGNHGDIEKWKKDNSKKID